MTPNFFDITPVDLDQLGPEPAVMVLREMIWAETSNLGIPITDSDIPFSITTADGGIDAGVKGVANSSGNGLIFAPRTCYQVKAGNFALNATAMAQIENLLIIPTAITARRASRAQPSGSEHKPESISPRIRECLDDGGTFVTMLFGNDTIDSAENGTEKTIQKFLSDIDPKYATAKIKVWRQSVICGLLRKFPSVSLQIKHLPGFQLLSHSQWAARHELRQQFVAAPKQQESINSLRAALRDDSHGSIHIRLIGEPGIGKTRFVLETLSADDLRPLVLYADRGTKIDGSVISALNSAKDARIILVVDECSPDVRSYLARNFGSFGSNLKIISIYQDRDETDDTSEYRLIEMDALPAAEIKKILESYGVDPAMAAGWAELCEGSPRVAHVIGHNLSEHPEDPLRSDGTAQIWVRYLASDEGKNSDQYFRRHLVISSLALFKRFGWGATVRANAHEVHDLIVSKLDPGLSKAEFDRIVQQMAHRKVLQGDNYLYLTPRALHIRLWSDWWNDYGASIDVNDFVLSLTSQMRKWFGDMLEYADAAPVSKRLVAEFLGPEGLYKDSEWLNSKEGSRFFLNLSLANPPKSLSLLERTIGKMDPEALQNFEAGRRSVIVALEGMALHSDLFGPSAKLLLALAESENETWSNNSTGVFANLFSLGYGELSRTSLAPEHRLPILIAAMKHNEARAMIALKAFETALAMRSITRWGGEQPFRLKQPITRWTPKTYSEWHEAYLLYWQALRQSLNAATANVRKTGAKILLSRTRELLRVQSLQGCIIETLKEISAYPEIDSRDIISTIESVLQYDKETLGELIVSVLSVLRDELVGVSFQSRLRRFVGMDMFHDQFDSKGREISLPDISNLAEQALSKQDDLRSELKWLVTGEAKNGYRYGYALGLLDAGRQVWPDIRDALYNSEQETSDYFVGGYLRAIFERDVDVWEQTIFAIAADEKKQDLLLGLIWRSGMTDRIAALILQLAREGKIPPDRLDLFSAGRTSSQISDASFADWLGFLTDQSSFAASATALNLASMSLLDGRQLTARQLEAILTQPKLYGREGRHSNVMLSHHWLQLCRELIRVEPTAESAVLRTFLDNIGNSGTITDSLSSEGENFIDDLVAKYPEMTWQTLSKYLNPPMDMRGFAITTWLRGDAGFDGRDPGPMRHIPRHIVLSWIEADPETRAAYVANMAPQDFTPDTWEDGLIRDILCKFGDSTKVQSAVFGNFFTGGWSGPASSHYAEQKKDLEKIKMSESDPIALRWINDTIDAVQRYFDDASIQEEAHGF